MDTLTLVRNYLKEYREYLESNPRISAYDVVSILEDIENSLVLESTY